MGTLKLRRSTTAGHVPASLTSGEIAINEADDLLFWRHSDGTVKSISLSLASLALTGNPTVPTQTAGDNSTKIANTAFVSAALAALVNSSPAALDTLKELADAIGDDANFSATMATALGNRLRVDTAAQGLSGTQQGNALTNLGATTLGKLLFAIADAAALRTAAGLTALATASFASQAQAEAGVDTATAMNPLRVAQAIAVLAGVPAGTQIAPTEIITSSGVVTIKGTTLVCRMSGAGGGASAAGTMGGSGADAVVFKITGLTVGATLAAVLGAGLTADNTSGADTTLSSGTQIITQRKAKGGTPATGTSDPAGNVGDRIIRGALGAGTTGCPSNYLAGGQGGLGFSRGAGSGKPADAGYMEIDWYK